MTSMTAADRRTLISEAAAEAHVDRLVRRALASSRGYRNAESDEEREQIEGQIETTIWNRLAVTHRII